MYRPQHRRTLLTALCLAFALVASACVPARPAAPVHRLTPDYTVAGQMHPADIRQAARDGYSLIINNRPDGESPDQPSSAVLQEAAQEAGIAYAHVPFRAGHVTPQALQKMQALLAARKRKTMAFCRSGRRATTIWALATTALGQRTPEAAIGAARKAGFDLRSQRERLRALAAGEQAKP